MWKNEFIFMGNIWGVKHSKNKHLPEIELSLLLFHGGDWGGEWEKWRNGGF
jgi:hypothetical protein